MDQRTLIQGRQILQEIAVVDIFRFFNLFLRNFRECFPFIATRTDLHTARSHPVQFSINTLRIRPRYRCAFSIICCDYKSLLIGID